MTIYPELQAAKYQNGDRVLIHLISINKEEDVECLIVGTHHTLNQNKKEYNISYLVELPDNTCIDINEKSVIKKIK
jgi:hypothetical protein